MDRRKDRADGYAASFDQGALRSEMEYLYSVR